MSLKYRDSSGTETPVAGLNGTSGELVPSVALKQSGTAAIYMPNTSELTDLFTTTVTFDTPFDDTNYVLNIDQCEVSEAEINRVYDRTTTGFTVAVMYNRKLTEVPSYNVTARIPWAAFKLMTDEVHEADSTHIAQNTANFASAFSETTSYAVGDYVTYNGVLYKCTTAHTAGVWVAGHFTQVTVGGTLSDIVPSDASSSNKLVATNAIYKTLTRYWNDVGVRFIKLSNAYPTFGLKTNNYIVSCRNGETYLLVCGTTDGGDIVAPQVYLLYSGTEKLVTNGFYYDSTTKEIAFMTQGYNAVSVTQISGEVRDIILSELSVTNPLSNPVAITLQKLVTASSSIGYYTGFSGATYTTLTAFLAALMAEIHDAIASTSGVMPFGGVWSGKSLFTGIYMKQDSDGGSFQIEFQNPQNDKVFYHGYTVNGSVTFTAIA